MNTILNKSQADNIKEIRIEVDTTSTFLNSPLYNSFTFVKGIGLKTESKLGKLGITCWDDVRKKNRPSVFPKQKWDAIWDGVSSIKGALEVLDISRLTDLIPKMQRWKMTPSFVERIAYVDIETTGLSYFFNPVVIDK